MSDAGSPRRLWLARPPNVSGGGGPPELAEGELHHARNVLRLQTGDPVLGLDGVGGAWPLRVTAVGRQDLVLELDGEPRREPAPGTGPGTGTDTGTGGGGPRLEVALSLPKGGRAEESVDRLTQLGVDRVHALVCERTPPHARELSAGRRRRLERAAREACKQAIRLWVPEILGPTALADLWTAPPTPTAFLDPQASRPLAAWLGELPDPREVRVVVGPEGGFTETELAGAAGAAACWLGPHVLRIETAAELAAGLVRHHLRGRDATGSR